MPISTSTTLRGLKIQKRYNTTGVSQCFKRIYESGGYDLRSQVMHRFYHIPRTSFTHKVNRYMTVKRYTNPHQSSSFAFPTIPSFFIFVPPSPAHKIVNHLHTTQERISKEHSPSFPLILLLTLPTSRSKNSTPRPIIPLPLIPLLLLRPLSLPFLLLLPPRPIPLSLPLPLLFLLLLTLPPSRLNPTLLLLRTLTLTLTPTPTPTPRNTPRSPSLETFSSTLTTRPTPLPLPLPLPSPILILILITLIIRSDPLNWRSRT
jgi:hypothetical protein